MPRWQKILTAKSLFLSWVLLISLGLSACNSLPSPLYEPAPLPKNTGEARLKKIWQETSGLGERWRGYELIPALKENLLIAGDSQGQLQAFNLQHKNIFRSGQLWQQNLVSGVSAGILLDGKNLYVPTQAGKLLALNALNGAFIWEAKLPSEALSKPQLLDSRLLVQTADGSVTALDANTGRQLWSYTSNHPALSLRGTSAPTLTSLQTYVGLANGKLVSLDNQDGQVRWEATIAKPEGRTDIERLVDVRGQAQLAKGMLVVNSFQGQTQALDPFTGESRWSRQISSYLAPIIVEDLVLVIDETSKIHALDLFSGNTLWLQEKLYGRELGQPVVLEDTLLSADYQGYVHLLDIKSGALTGRHNFDLDGISAPLLVDAKRLLVHSTRGRLGLFELEK